MDKNFMTIFMIVYQILIHQSNLIMLLTSFNLVIRTPQAENFYYTHKYIVMFSIFTVVSLQYEYVNLA